MIKACHISVTGLVQGVGFRPFVFRHAVKHNLSGWVRNTNECVEIFIQGEESAIDIFLKELRSDPPVASRINEVMIVDANPGKYARFTILPSENRSEKITEISPDIAVCADCLEDMKQQPNRINYPFVNCTNCGPRFTIINDLPYDRKSTSMKAFPMCDSCRREYEDEHDRRFHAQPVACSDCGPHYTLYIGNDKIEGIEDIVPVTTEIISKGGILAVKGLGGYHLACDARNEEAVNRLRLLKNREGKPLAVMFRDLDAIRLFTVTNEIEENSLTSWKRPIVLLTMRSERSLATGVSVGLNTVGAMLPYLPFHYLLFSELNIPAIVLTSGNISDEPILIDDKKTLDTFLRITDGVLTYNREIENRTDDSVVRVIDNTERVFRRSRGYVPAPVNLRMDTTGIVATGAELVNTFCIGKGNQAIISQYIGDLQNSETTAFYEETVIKFQKLFRMKPSMIAADLHPDYFTSRYAVSRQDFVDVVRVQHHHAHIASCMAEHGLDEPVLGVAMDGTGYGTDGNNWGAEFLYCDLADFKRVNHFEYVPLPGGDRGIEEPWRMAVSCLFKIYGEEIVNLDLPFLKKVERERMDFILNMIRTGINSPLVSSAGRLFDAVSAMLDLCLYSTFSAEAPMRLESIIEPGIAGHYRFEVNETISFDLTFRDILGEMKQKTSPGIISAKFHNTVILVIFEGIKKMNIHHHCSKVVLSGGTFQNKYLLEGTVKKLKESGFEVYSHHLVPTNDGGISLGQLAVAAKRRQLTCV